MIFVLVSPITWFLGIGAFVFRAIIQISVLNGAMVKLNEKKLLFFSIIFDIVLPLTYVYLYFSNYLNSKQHKWK